MSGRRNTGILPVAVVGLAACASSVGVPEGLGPRLHPVTAAASLPVVPDVDGPLAIDVVYPADSAVVTARDSTFIFGSTGSGRARLTINDAPVHVAPNGAFLAFLPMPRDGVYRLRATTEAESVTRDHVVVLPPVPTVPDFGAAILPESIEPRGTIALPRGEPVGFRFLGTAGGEATVQLPNGHVVRLVERPLPGGPGTAAANFQRLPDSPGSVRARVSEYAGAVPAGAWTAPDTMIDPPSLGMMAGPGSAPTLRLAIAGDAATAPVPVRLHPLDGPPVAGIVRAPEDAPTDWTIRGRPGPSGPFHWFWPEGTRLDVDGEWNGMYRVRLASDLSAWVPVADVELQGNGAPLARGTVSGVRMVPADDWVDVRIATPVRLPYRVDVDRDRMRITVYGGTSAVNFFQYGALDPLVRQASWSQPAADVFAVDLELSDPVWGYRAFFDAADALVVRVRRPPDIDPDRPLAGLLIAVDAGHPPAGATGPTRLAEAEANLGVALQLKPLLEAAGARVLLTRSDPGPVDLGARPRMAADFNADVLVSLHNNAFPDGVNPFENNGTSTYYYQAQSVDLARALQWSLLEELGLRDIGIGRADLALVRPTWMPSVLTETMFLMVPAQENALRDPATQARIARAHVRGLEWFLAGRAAGTDR